MESITQTAATDRAGFGGLLKQWRRLRGWSQLDLALETDVSARHLSFLETGRSRPSRRMVLRLAEALDLPFRQQNNLLLAAGFAPAFRQSALESANLQRIRESLEVLLNRHLPYPAFVLDRRWDIVMSNTAHDRLLGQLLPDRNPDEPTNALRLVLDPGQLRTRIANWRVVASTVVRRFERQYQRSGQPVDLASFRDLLLDLPGVRSLLAAPHEPEDDAILIPIELRVGDIETAWFTTLASFGSPLDVTLQELVIESLFPANEATEAVISDLSAAGPSDGVD